MIERESLALRFTDGLFDSYPPSTPYLIHHDGREVVASNSTLFRRSRQTLMELLLLGRAIQEEMSLSLALEHLVNLSLRAPLAGSGFTVRLTPQSLERSEPGHKGVDLLVTDSENLIYLGIDVKLRRNNSRYQRDGFGWNGKVLSPYIYLSLGNFEVDTREQNNILVREWVRRYAIPKIGSTGKIPQIDQFRTYLVTRIERSITGCLERLKRLRESNDFESAIGFPETTHELEVFEEKLSIMQSLFFELRQAG